MNPSKIHDLSLAMAVLHVLIEVDPAFRFFNLMHKDEISSAFLFMTNNSGDDGLLVFGENKSEALFLGFAHESALSDGYYDLLKNMRSKIPHNLIPLYDFAGKQLLDAATFCIWYNPTLHQWETANTNFPFLSKDTQKLGLNSLPDYPWFIDYIDGSAYFLNCFDGQPETFKEEVDENFYTPDVIESFDLNVIQQVYAHQPISEKMARSMNPNADWEKVKEEVVSLGYPIQ